MEMRIVVCVASDDANIMRGVMISDGFPPGGITIDQNVQQLTLTDASGGTDGAANVWVVIGRKD